MTQKKIETLAVEELVDLFENIGVAQDNAILDGNTANYNRLYMQMASVADELKRRPGDQRRALLRLFESKNVQVRLMAAKKTLAVAPIEARHQIETIAGLNWFGQSGDAASCLGYLDSGFFKPT